MQSTAYIPPPPPPPQPLPSKSDPELTKSKYFHVYSTATAGAPILTQPDTILKNGPTSVAPTPMPEQSISAPPKNTWALIVGVSGSYTNPTNEVYTVAGSEFVFGDINTAYTYEGYGASWGEGANASVYIALTPNIASAQDWEGYTDAKGITMAGGLSGFTFGEEQGEALGKDSPGAFIFGWSPGAEFSLWSSQTYVNGP